MPSNEIPEFGFLVSGSQWKSLQFGGTGEIGWSKVVERWWMRVLTGDHCCKYTTGSSEHTHLQPHLHRIYPSLTHPTCPLGPSEHSLPAFFFFFFLPFPCLQSWWLSWVLGPSFISVFDRPGPAVYVWKQRSSLWEESGCPWETASCHLSTPSITHMMGVEAKDCTPTPQILLSAISSGTLMPPHCNSFSPSPNWLTLRH